MSWHSFDVLLALIAAVGWMMLPGALTGYVMGLRGLVVWAVAPTISTPVIAVSAVLASALGWAWAPPAEGLVAAVPAALVLVVRLLLRRGLGRAGSADTRRVQRAASWGLVPALVIGAVTVMRGFRTPDAMSQTYDAVFHYNALRWILDSHDASSLTLGALGRAHVASIYPAAWHDLASLVALSSAAPITVAANITAAVLAVLAWPLACVFLVRQVFGPSARALAVTGVVSVGFAAFPWGLLTFGVLWPNALGLVLVPAGLGAGLSLAGLAVHDALTRSQAWFLLVAAVLGTGFAQPNTTFSLVLLLLFPAGHALVRWVRRQHQADRTARGVLGALGAVAAVIAAWIWVDSLAMVAQIKNFDWVTYASIPAAVGEALLNATNGRSALWLLSAAVVVGAVVAFRRRATVWLPLAHLATVALFVMCAAIQSPTTHTFTGYWFNDSYRLAAALPITGVALGVGGVTWAAAALHERARGWTPMIGALRGRLPSVAACTALLGVALFAVTAVRYQQKAVEDIRKSYPDAAQMRSSLVSLEELAFFSRIHNEIPPDAVVASNPWNGSAMMWALERTRVLFPQLNQTTWSDDQKYLARQFNQAASDPAVCRIAKANNVQYLMIGDVHFWVSDERIHHYPGLRDPHGRPGFALVDQQGPLKLYRLTACTPAAAAPPRGTGGP
jgi:hypothetical protein